MARYVVLKSDTQSKRQKVLVMRDDFSVLALLFPVPFLLFRRLWLEAVLAIGITILVSVLSSAPWALGISIMVNISLGVIVALESSGWAIAKEKRRGYQEIAVIADAHSREEAELRAFATFGAEPLQTTASNSAAATSHAHRDADMLFGRP